MGVVVYTSFREVAWAAVRHPCGDSCESVERERQREMGERVCVCVRVSCLLVCAHTCL